MSCLQLGIVGFNKSEMNYRGWAITDTSGATVSSLDDRQELFALDGSRS